MKFKTIIITKKMIVLSICALIITVGGIISVINTDDKNNNNLYSSSDDLHEIILSQQLNTDGNSSEIIKKVVNILLGFDLQKPQTILLNYSEDVELSATPDAKEYVYPQKAEENKKDEVIKSDETKEKPIKEFSYAKGMSISNATDIKVNTAELILGKLGYNLDGEGPQVLIVHTHTTESYTDSGKTKYTAQDTDRSTDETKNITAVGNVLYETLKNKGINVIHDTTVHDYPSYNGAYNRSKATVIKNLEKYPSIKLVLDVHRDGIVKADGTKVKVACDINGEKVAQCMFVVGSNVSLTHDNWIENMRLACKLQNTANEMYPELMRPINLRQERFNQQLSTGALIIEVGSNGNTLNEAKNSAKLMANVISQLFGK